MKGQKPQKKSHAPKPAPKTGEVHWNIISVLVLLYLAIEIIPPMSSADITGPQWLYVSFLNLVSVIVIFRNEGIAPVAVRVVLRNIISWLYMALFVLAGFSAFVAFNKIESMVALAKLANTLVAFMILAVLLYNRLYLFKWIALLLTIILGIQSLSVLSQFFKGLNDTPLPELIFNLKGNSGNKNILAAALAIKIPFALYLAWDARTWQRVLVSVLITIALLAIAFLNARTAYLSILVQSLAYAGYCIYLGIKQQSLSRQLPRLGYFLIPVILAFILSTIILKNAAEPASQAQPYGTVAERLGNIAFTVEGSNARLFLWSNAMNYIQDNPAMGCGYGNWKITSIPYEKTFFDNLIISYHVHNDFLEMTAELGILGGLLYLALFLIAFFYFLRTMVRETEPAKQMFALFGFLALLSYSVDASLNFPMDRTSLQVYFVFLLALAVNLVPSSIRPVIGTMEKGKGIKLPFMLATLILAIPALIVSISVFRSLKAQYIFNRDAIAEQPRHTWSEVKDAFPSIPNMNTAGFPIALLKARYLIESKQYAQAVEYLQKGDQVNPHLSFSDFLRAKMYMDLQRPDTALYFARKAFEAKPRADNNYLMFLFVAYSLNDTAIIRQAFQQMRSYRDEPWVWDEYIKVMSAMKVGDEKLRSIIDSAYQRFPNDATIRARKGTR